MADENGNIKNFAKKLVFKALKAFLKSIVFYIAYLLVWSFFSTFEGYVHGLRQTVENFVIIYISLGFFSDLVSDTIFQQFFNVARAIFVMGYLTLALNGGILNLTYMDIALTIDLRLFLMVAVMLSLLGLARSMLQAINYAHKKAESASNL